MEFSSSVSSRMLGRCASRTYLIVNYYWEQLSYGMESCCFMNYCTKMIISNYAEDYPENWLNYFTFKKKSTTQTPIPMGTCYCFQYFYLLQMDSVFQKLKATLKIKSVQVTRMGTKSHSLYSHTATNVLQHAFHYYVRFNIKKLWEGIEN